MKTKNIKNNEKVRLDIIDYSFARVSANKGVIKPFTSFRVPGAHFSKLYKEKKWDGTVSIVKRNNLPVGLIPYFVKECSKRNIEIEIYANRKQLKPSEISNHIYNPPIYDNDTVEEMLKLLPSSINVRYYQTDAFMAFIKAARGMIVLPTGAGKSLNIYMTAYMLRSVCKTGLIIVPRVDLVDQISESIRLFSSYTVEVLSTSEHGINVLNMLKEKNNIIVTTWQSWTNWMETGDAITPDYVIIDEAHTVAKKKMPWDFMKAFANTKYRFGLTATENERLYERYTVIGLTGPILYTESAGNLIEKDFLATPYIHNIDIFHKITDQDNINGVIPKNHSMKDLVRRRERMELVSDIIPKILPDKKSFLILTESVEYEIEPLVKILSKNKDLDVYNLDGSSSRDERKRVINIINNPEKRSVLCVTYGLFQMGINIPSLGYLMFYSPSRSHIRVLQSVGRGLRPKDLCHVYDLSDSSENRVDSMVGQRKEIYKKAYGSNMKFETMHIEL